MATEVDAASATLDWLEGRYGVMHSRDVMRLVSRITKRLSSSVYKTALETELKGNSPDRYGENFPWQVFVLNSTEPFAGSLGGGMIILTKGLLLRTGTEAELASIIAHEMSHQILGHTREALSESDLSTSGPQFAFSLEQELDADRLGLKLLQVSRYFLADAAHALTIVYRPLDEVVATNEPNWLPIRLANLHQYTRELENGLPATQSTREFNRVRKSL